MHNSCSQHDLHHGVYELSRLSEVQGLVKFEHSLRVAIRIVDQPGPEKELRTLGFLEGADSLSWFHLCSSH